MKVLRSIATLALLSSLAAQQSSAQGFTRQICFGTDRETGQRNEFVAIAQQIENTEIGPEGYVPSHPEFEPRKAIGQNRYIPFRVFVYDYLPEALNVQSGDHEEFASRFLSDLKATRTIRDAFAERLRGITYYFWDGVPRGQLVEVPLVS